MYEESQIKRVNFILILFLFLSFSAIVFGQDEQDIKEG